MKKLKNITKRIATLGLAAVLTVNSFPATAFAAEESSGGVFSDLYTSAEREWSRGEPETAVIMEEELQESNSELITDAAESDVDENVKQDESKDSEKDEAKFPAFEESKSIDSVKITVSAEEGVFPEGAVLFVEKVTIEQEKQAEEAVEDKRPDEQNVAVSYTYDIKVLDKDGNEIQPADERKVKVSFKLEKVADDNLTTNVYHIMGKEDDETENTADAGSGDLVAEKLEVETDGDTAIAETDGFSLYTVEFTYNDLQYVLPGDSEVEISQILSNVGLSGEVAEVSVSDSSLFSAAKNDNNEWIVTAHKAFSSKEWMKVTINDVVYEITVTDDNDVINIEATEQTISETTTWTDCTVNITGSGTVTFSERITISGSVTLNLGEGATLKASKGIAVGEGNSLTIDGNGSLKTYRDSVNDAAIGGSSNNAGTITINGGNIYAESYLANKQVYSAAIGGGKNGNGGIITINGGTVETLVGSGKAASIGGGYGAAGGRITITGGTVNAKRGTSGGKSGAAIGGGENGNGGTILISGGTVSAPNPGNTCTGAGIGGGIGADGGNITITGGNITAAGGSSSAGIGGGDSGSAGTITIEGGVIRATGGGNSAGIGGGYGSGGSGGTIVISGGQVYARGTNAYGIGSGKDGSEGTISLSWTNDTDFIDASYAGAITIVNGKRFYYDGTADYATAEGLYHQEKKIVPAIVDNSSLVFAEIKMPRGYVTDNGSEVNVSYEVYDSQSKKLTLGTDYSAVIKNSENNEVTVFNQWGDYTLTITGMGAYHGSKSYVFSLVEWDKELTEDGSEHYVNLPSNGTSKTVYLNNNQSIKVYDSEGKNGALKVSDGQLIVHAPEGYALQVTGRTDAMKYNETQHEQYNSLSAYEGEDSTNEIISLLLTNSENILFASDGSTMLIRLNVPKVYPYADQYGLDLTVTVIHKHHFVYTSDAATITATCDNPGCHLPDNKATLTIAAPTGSLTYDGTAKVASLSGDTTILGTPEITYTKDGAAFTGTPTAAGEYTASISLGSATASVDYVIAKVELTSLAVDITGWAYGDVANEPSVSGNTGNGEVTYEYKVKDASDSTYSTTVPTAAGNYTVRATVAELTNYNGKAVTKDFTIAKKAVTVTAKAQSVEVGGELSQDVSNATLTGALDGHMLASITLTPSSVESIGTGTITASDAHIKNGNTDVTDNYEISYTEGALTVTSPQVYIFGITAKNKEYNGNTDATIEGTAVIKTVRDNNDVTGLSAESIVAAFEDANAGSNKAVTISSATLTGEGAANYTLNIEKTNEKLGLKANITAKSVTVTVTAMNRDYDPDSTTVELNAGSVNDVVGGDNVTVDVSSATGTMENADAGTSKPVTVTGVKLGGAKAGNYKISEQPTGVTVTISKIGYTGNKIAAATVRSGQITTDAILMLPALPAGASYAASGTVSGTTALISNHSISGTTLTYSTTSQNDGTSATITIGVTGATNYEDYSVVVTVTARDKEDAGVTINGGNEKTVIYGDEDFTLSKTVSAPGTGDGGWTWTSNETSVATIDETSGLISIKKIGTTTITAKYESETTLGEASITLTVDPKTIGISWSNTSFTYDGESHVPTASLIGVKSGDTCTVSVTGAQTNAGSHTATASLSGTDSGNYILPEDKKTCSFTISKANIRSATVTLGSTLTYTGTEQTQSVSKVELNGKTVPSSAYTITNNKGTNAGSYSLTVTAKADSNYTGSVSKTFTIAKKAITPTVSVTGSYSYTGSAITPTYTVKNGNTALATSDYTASVKDNINAGEGKLTIAAATGGNYSFDPVTVSFTIAKAAHEDVQAGGELKYGLSGTVALASYIEAGGSIGTISVSDPASVLSGTPSVSGTTLSYSFADNAENAGKTAVVTVPVKDCTNYADYSILVTLTVIDCAHEHTEIRDIKTASCTEQGYTGDTYCKDCGKKLQSGEATPIDPDNHAYDSGVITKQPTIFEEGVRTYTCTRCHHTYTETVPKVDDGEDHSDLIEDITDEEGKTKAEVKTEDKEDGSKETTVTVGGQEVEKTVTDAEGNETVETHIWIGGLSNSYPYTGSAIKPSFHVYDGTKKLSSGTDYSVSYKNNKNAGDTATIMISFKGNYKGTAQEKLSFSINPAVLGADVEATDVTTYAAGKTLRPVPVMKWASTGKSIDMKNFSFTYKDSADTVIDGIKEAGQYKVVITSKNGSFTGETEAAITVTGSKKLLLSGATVKLSPSKYTYTGDPITPAVGSYTLKLNGKTLTEGTDYYVSDIRNNTNPGKATIVFTAKDGNQAGYVGEKSVAFTISKGRALKDGDGFTYSYSESVPYAKGGAKPTVVVKDGDDTLKAGTDYTVSYSKNTKVTNGATAVITIKGEGNYKGSVKKYFTITKQDISKLAGKIITADKVESKKGYKNPTVTITDLDGKKLKAGTDFAIVSDSYSGPDTNGVVTATVSGKGSYTGTASITYRYIKGTQQLSKVKAMKSLANKTYTGREVRLTNADLTGILYTGSKSSPVYLIPGTDFKVISYTNNTKTGTAKVTIQGIGAYGGTRTLSFKIVAKQGDYKGFLVGGEWTKVQ